MKSMVKVINVWLRTNLIRHVNKMEGVFTKKMFFLTLSCVPNGQLNLESIYGYIWKKRTFCSWEKCIVALQPTGPNHWAHARPYTLIGPRDSFVPNITLAWMRLFAPASSKKKIICSSLNFTLSYSLRGPLNKRCGLTSIIASPIDST